MKKILFSSIICSLALSACSAKYASVLERTEVALMPKSPAALKMIAPLQSSLEKTNIGACELLDELRGGRTAVAEASTKNFQLFSSMHDGIGSMNIDANPFVQFILGEQFAVDNDESFIDKARAKYDAGQLGTMKWLMVKLLNGLGLLNLVKYSATDDGLIAAFPGIFGGEQEVAESLVMKLAKKSANLEKISQEELSAVLTSATSLFPESRSWSDWPRDVQKSMSAVIQSLNGNVEKEKLCSLVLLQRNFSQLLSLKGYMRASMISAEAEPRKILPELSGSNPSFAKESVTGAFFDQSISSTILLSQDGIQQYDPSKKLLSIAEKIPLAGTNQDKAGNLKDELSLLEGLIYFYEASQPAAKWNKNLYVFGDIQSESNKAIVPAESHALALGLITIEFKNLAAKYIQKINGAGQKLRENEKAAGIILGAVETDGAGSIKVTASEVARLVRIVVYLDNALRQMSPSSVEFLKGRNEVYSDATLARLLGKNLFTQESLDKILSKEEQGNVLADNLQALKFPLATLTQKLLQSKCSTALSWNLESGAVQSLGACNGDEQQELADALQVLGEDVGSSLLVRAASAAAVAAPAAAR